jgi:hypothetical protein
MDHTISVRYYIHITCEREKRGVDCAMPTFTTCLSG